MMHFYCGPFPPELLCFISKANLDYNGDYDESHTKADLGGEFVIAYEYDLSFLDLLWYIPLQDMVNIYHRIGYIHVTSKDLVECNAILYAEVQAVRLVGDLAFAYSAIHSPFMVDSLKDWVIGGVDSNAQWTMNCWPFLFEWIIVSNCIFSVSCKTYVFVCM